MKIMLALLLFLLVSLIQWGCVNGVVDGFEGGEFFVGMLVDNLSLIGPFLFFGLYTKLPMEAVETLSFMPFLFVIFFSSTFSPSSGVKGVEELRYLFSRFYIFCSIPSVKDSMKGCPDSDLNTLYLILSGFIFIAIFVAYKFVQRTSKSITKKKDDTEKNKLKDSEFHDLQVELYGESNHSMSAEENAVAPSDGAEEFA